MNTTRRTWIDVTDFLKWQGNFTGFQHIQYNMAKQYMAAKKNVAFFIYDDPAHAFKQIDFDPDTVSKDGIIAAVETITPAPSRTLLSTVKRYAPPQLKRVVKRALKAKNGTSLSVPLVNSSQSPFETTDVVMVLGGIWHGSFAEDMAREKKKKNFTFVHIVHDMIPTVTPQYVVEDLPAVFSAYKERIFNIADGLIVNSQSSKKDALAFMKQRHIKVPQNVVFRIADEPVDEKLEKAVAGVPKDDFITAIGTIEGRKNHQLLYYAYKQAAREGIELPTLVIAGRNGWQVEDFLYVVQHDPDVNKKILIRNNVTNSERAWLFKHCKYTIWPSFYEGWGMPVAESLAYGKLCLSSDTASMPEVGGDLNEYFSPYSIDECLRLMQKYQDKKALAEREKRIKKDYKPTTWNDMFRQISEFVDTL